MDEEVFEEEFDAEEYEEELEEADELDEQEVEVLYSLSVDMSVFSNAYSSSLISLSFIHFFLSRPFSFVLTDGV